MRRRQKKTSIHALHLLLVLLGVIFLSLSCAQDRYTVDLRYAPRLGNPDAPIEIVVFSDFQCAFCKRTAHELGRIVRTRPKRIKVFFKHFPLSYHPQAINAAKAAEAARLQGKFWPMHDQLFAQSEGLIDESYNKIAAEIGLDVERFASDMAKDTTRYRVAADRAEGEHLGIDGTPYIIINRRRFRGSHGDLSERVSGIEGFN